MAINKKGSRLGAIVNRYQYYCEKRKLWIVINTKTGKEMRGSVNKFKNIRVKQLEDDKYND